jgi:hypothetical protein
MHDDSLLDKEALALLLGIKAETVRFYSTQYPGRVPPRVTWSKKPLWDRAVVARWLAERNGTKENPPIVIEEVKPEPVERPRRVPRTGRPRNAGF